MENIFADRMADVPKSFIREILKISLDPNIISFAGGLPNKDLFPDEALQKATSTVFSTYGKDCFQYSNSEGYVKLRELIAGRYKLKKNIDVNPENILITNGAQQGLDLLGKVILNDNDGVVVEQPGYLGALQAFSIYCPQFLTFNVNESGVNLSSFENAVSANSAKLIYTVPNFQNPSGITYSKEDREAICSRIEGERILLIEDDPYGELRFRGFSQPSFYSYLPEQTILLGSFSKTVIPGFRVGWIVAPDNVMEKLLIAKQASDLHTCHFTQYIFYQYLLENDVDAHIQTIVNEYGGQCDAMIAAMEKYFPNSISFTRPEGGMFLWAELPEGYDSMDLFNLAVKKQVVFVPGTPFFVGMKTSPAFRLSFSCVNAATIEVGIQRLTAAVKELLG